MYSLYGLYFTVQILVLESDLKMFLVFVVNFLLKIGNNFTAKIAKKASNSVLHSKMLKKYRPQTVYFYQWGR